jgi:hypothetical protein
MLSCSLYFNDEIIRKERFSLCKQSSSILATNLIASLKPLVRKYSDVHKLRLRMAAHMHTDLSAGAVESAHKHTDLSSEAVESPNMHTDLSSGAVEPAHKHTDLSAGTQESARKHTDLSADAVDSAHKHTNLSADAVESPHKHTDLSADVVEPVNCLQPAGTLCPSNYRVPNAGYTSLTREYSGTRKFLWLMGSSAQQYRCATQMADCRSWTSQLALFCRSH